MRSAYLLVLVLLVTASAPLRAQRDNTIRAQVDLVVVPASVRDENGKFIYGLTPDDFTVLEDGRQQSIKTLSSDAVPLSVSVLIDTALGADALNRFADSIPSLGFALTDADEIEAYRFDHIVNKISDFTSSREDIEKRLLFIKKMAENRPPLPPAAPSIFAGRGPAWLRWLLGDSGREFKDLNDPMFTSAEDLEMRGENRRKIILVISDGEVADDAGPFRAGSTIHSFKETRDRLVQHQIQMYAVAVGDALIGGPGSILNSYADATGGDVYKGRTQSAMETAFQKIMEQARNEYVLSYVSNNEVRGQLAVTRQIEVRANPPGLKVTHRRTYLQYPIPR